MKLTDWAVVALVIGAMALAIIFLQGCAAKGLETRDVGFQPQIHDMGQVGRDVGLNFVGGNIGLTLISLCSLFVVWRIAKR